MSATAPGGDVDVIIDFTGTAGTFAASIARQGVWQLDSFSQGRALGAALAGTATTSVDLIRHPASGEAPRRVATASYDTKDLATHNACYVRQKSVHLLLRELARLHRDGMPADMGPAPPPAPRPGVLALPGYIGRSFGSGARRMRRKLGARLGRTPGQFGLRIGCGDLLNFDPATATDIPIPANRLWADPFLFSHGGALWCFFEDYDYAKGYAGISAGRVTLSGIDDVRPVMVPPHHLSFPFIFRARDEIFLMPEAHQAGRLEIWRSVRFPDEWELYSTGPDNLPMVDSVLFERAGEWWLFTHIPTDSFGDFCNELHVYRTDGPELTWLEPHALNPVVIGAATARGGGRVHNIGDRLFRVSQDNSGGIYGYGFNVMEIFRLDLAHYEENRLRRVTPDFIPGLIGTHHFDTVDGWFVLDLRRP